MKQMMKVITALIILTMLVVTIKAGGWNDTTEVNKLQVNAEVDEIEKILESFMKTEDFDNKFFAKKANMTIEEFEKFLKKPVSGRKKVGEAEILGLWCGKCNSGKYIEVKRDCSQWSITGNERKCPDLNFGVDLELVRYCYSIKRCDGCGYELSGNWKEYSWECHGFNRFPKR